MSRSRGGTPLPPLAPQNLTQVNDGNGSVALDAQGQLVGADGLAPETQQLVKTALEKQTMVVTQPPLDLTGRQGTLMGGKTPGVSFSLFGPVGGILRSDRPSFRWQPTPHATSYVVTVSDQSFNEVASSGPLTSTNWQPGKSLPRGGVYIWQVKAVTADGQEIVSPVAPAPEAKFKVLEAEYEQALAQAQKTHGNSHLILGLLYARAGLLPEAERELQALLRANPNSPVARNLLKELQKQKRK